jgi:hypothetical protein
MGSTHCSPVAPQYAAKAIASSAERGQLERPAAISRNMTREHDDWR